MSVGDLAEVELHRGPAVPDRCRRRDLLLPVEMAEGHITQMPGKRLRRDVVSHDVGIALAAPRCRPIDEGVADDDIHGVDAHISCQRLDHLSHPVLIGLDVLIGVETHDLLGLDDPSLRDEGEESGAKAELFEVGHPSLAGWRRS